MDLWIYGVVMATVAVMLWSGCVIATALWRRAPGMTLMRMPVFTWTMVVTCLMVLFAFPALLVALGLLWAQRHVGGVLVGNGGAVAYQELFWFYGHPVVYVMFFPFVGMVGEILATFSSRRFFGYPAFVVALLAFSGLSMTVWGHHMFTFGQTTNKYFSLSSTALIVPAGIEYFDFLGTIWKGKLRFTTAFLFALAFLVQFLIGGLTGEILASPPLDYGLNMSYFVVAHFHYTIFAGSAFGLFGGIYFWFPKLTGAMLRERLGKVHFVLMVIGTNLDVLPDVRARRGGHDATHRRLPALERLAAAEPARDRRRVRDRARHARLPRQRRRSRCATVSRPAMTRGRRTRSSGRPARRRHATTSPRCRRSARTRRCSTCARPRARGAQGGRTRRGPSGRGREARRGRAARVGDVARRLDAVQLVFQHAN